MRHYFEQPFSLITTLTIALLCARLATADDVTIEKQPGPHLVSGPTYKATVASDGCLTQLIIDGEPFLSPGVNISRGSYFYFNGALKLPNISQPDGQTILAEGDLATIKYHFGSDKMTWTLTSKNEEPMVFFFVLDKEVQAMRDADGKLHPAVIAENGERATWIRKNATLTINGSTKFWGPWQDLQVVECSVPAKATQVIELIGGKTSDADRQEIANQIAPVMDEPEELTIRSPLDYQVFQRDGLTAGDVRISGTSRLEIDQVEILLEGPSTASEFGELPSNEKNWHAIPWQKTANQFQATLRIPAGGWYQLKLRALKNGSVVYETSVDHVGVGEVFVGAGQSNSTNCGEFKTKQTSNMVASFGGTSWKIADDPQLGVADKTKGGSFWPAFGDKLYDELKVPIGVATTGFGGTSVNQWHPDEHLFKWMMTRIGQLGPNGFRAVLWHQGESDVKMNSDEYYKKLASVIRTSKQTAGWEFPWYVAQVSYHNPEEPAFESTRSAHAKLWADGVALPGPDTDTLTGDHRDLDGKGIHFSPKGLKAHGEMWAEMVLPQVLEATSELETAGSH